MLSCEVNDDGSLTVRAVPTPLFAQYKRSARARRKKWRLDAFFFDEITRRPCHYCGAEPARHLSGTGRRLRRIDGARNGVDRVDNRRGYEVDNVAACCWPCNAAKCTHTPGAFLDHCARLAPFVNGPPAGVDRGRCALCGRKLNAGREALRYCALCETFAFRDRRQVPPGEIYALAARVVAHQRTSAAHSAP